MPAVFYLVRHGKAEKDAPGGDAARRLTADGRSGFEALARALAPRLRLRRVLTSPFARARETAEVLAALTGASLEEEEALASGRSTGRQILALLRERGAGTAAVGHNPEVADAVALAAGRDVKVRPGTIAQIGERDGELGWIEAPEKGD